MENAKAEFAKRLIAAMQVAGYEARPAVLEREFNQRYWGTPVTLQGVRRWLRGEVIPPHDKVGVLADWLNVTPQELGFGKLPVRIVERRKRWDDGIGFQEREIIEAFLSLPVPQRRVLREVIEAFVKAYSAESANTP